LLNAASFFAPCLTNKGILKILTLLASRKLNFLKGLLPGGGLRASDDPIPPNSH
jgi:hypothetical protein